MHIVGISLMAIGVFGLVAVTLHLAWQEIQSLRYVSRLDRWGEPARRASDDEWSQDIPEWH